MFKLIKHILRRRSEEDRARRWSYPVKTFCPHYGEYNSGGLVWLEDRPAEPVDLEDARQTLGEHIGFDVYSLCGKDDPLYSTFWRKHDLKLHIKEGTKWVGRHQDFNGACSCGRPVDKPKDIS